MRKLASKSLMIPASLVLAGLILNSLFTISPAQSKSVFGGPDDAEIPEFTVDNDQIAFVAGDSPEIILEAEEGPQEGAGFFILDEALVRDEASPFSSAIAGSRDGTVTYTVVEGDTLSSIAEKFGLKMGTLLGSNKGLTANLQIGKEMVILPIDGVIHTVASGDTLSGIARKYGVETQKITDFNALEETLVVGTKLVVPGGRIATGAATTATTRFGSLPSFPGYFAVPTKGVITQGLHGHNGIDFGAPRNTNVYASAAGTVARVNVGTYNGGYGNLVVINHDNGTQTWYAHLNDVAISVGAEVTKNQVIGHVGSTGKSSGPHLHFEVRGGQNPFNR